MSSHLFRKLFWITNTLAALACAAMLFAFVDDVPTHIREIMGLPGTAELNRGQRLARRSQAQYRRLEEQIQERGRQYREGIGARLAALPSLETQRDERTPAEDIEKAKAERRRRQLLAHNAAVRRSRLALQLKQKEAERKKIALLARKNHEAQQRLARAKMDQEKLALELRRSEVLRQQLATQLKQAEDMLRRSAQPVRVVETPYQNLTCAFVNPNKAPVADLKLVATVKTRDGKQQAWDLTTDKDGRVHLTKIGPLPVSVDIALAAGPSAEWQVKEPERTVLLIAAPLGPKVAIRPHALAQIASLRPVLPRSVRFAGQNNALPPLEKHEDIIHEDPEPHVVEVERTVVNLDVAAPVGSQIIPSVLGAQPQTVPVAGIVLVRLPASVFTNGPIPLQVLMVLPGGEAETVIKDYSTDPYGKNEIKVERTDLHLARLTQLDLPEKIGVMSSKEQVIEAFGDPKRQDKKHFKIEKMSDGADWWDYDQGGVCFKMRTLPRRDTKNNPIVVERIRILSPTAGSLGGVTVGTSVGDVEKALGAPQPVHDRRLTKPEDATSGDKVETYLDNGLRLGVSDGRVHWIEVARPTPLLARGTTAFVPRRPARLYVEQFRGDPQTNLANNDDLNRYLARVHAVQIVNTRDEADLMLDARVGFREKRDKALGILPFRYEATTDITYTLTDAAGNAVAKDKVLSATSSADYTKDYEGAATMVVAGQVQKNNLIKLLTELGGSAQVIRTLDMVRRAVNRCAAASGRAAFNQMIADISRTADFSVRVTEVDYNEGTVRLNAGASSGVDVGGPGDPFEFELLIEGTPLPGEEGGRKTEFWSAVVESVEKDSCVCRLERVSLKSDQGFEKFERVPSRDLAKLLPDADTGILSARAMVHFPALQIVPDFLHQPRKGDSRPANHPVIHRVAERADQDESPSTCPTIPDSPVSQRGEGSCDRFDSIRKTATVRLPFVPTKNGQSGLIPWERRRRAAILLAAFQVRQTWFRHGT